MSDKPVCRSHCYYDYDTKSYFDFMCSFNCRQRLCDGVYCPAFCSCSDCLNDECPMHDVSDVQQRYEYEHKMNGTQNREK